MLLRRNVKHLGGACSTLRQHLLLQHQLCKQRSARCSCTAAALGATSTMASTPSVRMSASDVQEYISKHNVKATLASPPALVHPNQIIKSMVLIIKDASPTAATSLTCDDTFDTAADSTAAAAPATCVPHNPTTAADCGHESSSGYAFLARGIDEDLSNSSSCDPAAAAVLVLLTAAVRVDERAVADHLGLPRRRVRLATRQEAAAVTGYEVGGIPPFGHQTPLTTLADVSITQQLQSNILQQQQQQQPLLYAGDGSPDTQLLLTAHQLLTATNAQLGCFTQPTMQQQQHDDQAAGGWQLGQQQPGLAAALEANINQQQQQPLQQQQQQWVLQLPLPWPAGSTDVQLIGVVAQRRRLAKLLLFCSVVPESVPPLPADGTAAYVRKLWRHPEQQDKRCEVQLIMGKTLERKLGRGAAAALMDSMKVGSIISVTGRVQQNPAAAKAQVVGGSSSSSSSSSAVLDVVAHEVRVLYKSRDMLTKALRQAQRQGQQGLKTAAQLLQLHQQQQQQNASSAHGAGADGHTGAEAQQQQQGIAADSRSIPATLHADKSQLQYVNIHSGSSIVGSSSVASPDGDAIATVTPAAAAATTTAAAAASAPAPSRQYWQMPLAMHDIHWVCDLQSIQHMQQIVLSKHHTSSSNDGRSSSTHMADTVVGLDCEWKPYERGSQPSPVALLQLATRQHVFLIDMLAICTQQQQQLGMSGQHSNGSSSGTGSTCSTAEAALGDFLLQLLCDAGIAKLGFQLTADLDRLQQSYPQLACFQPSAIATYAAATTTHCSLSPTGAAPLLSYIDLLQLSRAAIPSLVKAPHISLSRLVTLVLGKPLDKTQQTSSWDVRPLSPEQQVYAAADAHVLTCLYDAVLQRLPQEMHAAVLNGVSGVKYLPVTSDDAKPCNNALT